MGIFDGASQKQLSSQQIVKTNREVQEMQMQHEAAMQQMKMQAYNQAALTGITGMSLGNYGTQAQKQAQRFDPNKSEAYQVPLSQLVTMWQVKYGDAWVDAEKPYDPKDFYDHAYNRLNENRLFERVDGWVRLKENVEKLLADR